MKTITCILLLLMGSMGFSQNNKAKVESLLNQFTTELTERGITNFFTTKRYCLGTTEMFRIFGDCKIVFQRFPKGTAKIEYFKADDAAIAVNDLNGLELDEGATLQVRYQEAM